MSCTARVARIGAILRRCAWTTNTSVGLACKVPVLSFGTATFGGVGDFFKAWGSTDVAEAKRLIDICLEHGVNFFDTANVYSRGRSEEVLGAALAGRRDEVLIGTKATFPMGDRPNDIGSSRYSLIRACEASLRRLGTDYIDVYYMHGFDATTPVEETLSALDDLTRSGKIRYIGCSNFSGWHLMKSLSVSERYGWSRYVANQAYYSLASREFEWELMPLALDQKVGTVVWSALAGGALSGKLRRGQPAPSGSRLAQCGFPGRCPVRQTLRHPRRDRSDRGRNRQDRFPGGPALGSATSERS